jgi:hypothetical protein
MTTIRMPFQLYIVETDPNNQSHHGLHTNTSPHLLARTPKPGDRIVATINGQMEILPNGEGGWQREWLQLELEGDVTRHAGRSATLGEDGLEDAFGGDALESLVTEILEGDCCWNYAPVTYTERDDIRFPSWERKGDSWRCNS